MAVVAIDHRGGYLFGSDGVSSTDCHGLGFLLCYSGDLVVTWNLDQLVAPILRSLPLLVCRSLSDNGRVFYRPYSITYNRSKNFSVKSGRRSVTVYGIDQYWPDDEPGPGDVFDTKARVNCLLSSLESALGVAPRRLTSPVAVYDDFLFKHLDLPTVCDMPLECAEYALRCTNRQWVSNYQIGHWGTDECWDYDLTAAYPAEAARLVDFRGAEFVKSELFVPATYGFLRGVVTVVSPVSPIMAEVGDTQLNPVGSWETFITLDEVEHLRRWGIGDFKLYDGWFVRAGNDTPLRRVMEGMYRRRGQDDLSSRFVKRAANGLIGRLLETRDNGRELGALYNPLWHAVITSRVRVAVSNFLYSFTNIGNLIHVGTDGCLLDRPVVLPVGEEWGNGIGSWRFTGSEPTFVLSPGLLFAGPRHPKGIHHNLLLGMVSKHPKTSSYSVKLQRRVTLAEAVAARDIRSVGTEKDFYSVVDLYMLAIDQDRVFPMLPKTGHDLLNKRYNSSPAKLP